MNTVCGYGCESEGIDRGVEDHVGVGGRPGCGQVQCGCGVVPETEHGEIDEVRCSHVNVVERTPERVERLMDALGLRSDRLSESRAQQLRELAHLNSSLFGPL